MTHSGIYNMAQISEESSHETIFFSFAHLNCTRIVQYTIKRTKYKTHWRIYLGRVFQMDNVQYGFN